MFGEGGAEEFRSLTAKQFENIFEGVPTKKISRSLLDEGIDVIKLFSEETNFFPSKAEARRIIQGKGASINKQTVSLNEIIKSETLINNKYLLLQKGKKNYFMVIVE